MNSLTRTCLVAGLCVVLLTPHISAQRPDVRFGQVSIMDLKNHPDINDTTAEAVILYDKGYFNRTQVNFSRHLRIKILKPSGTHWGDWVINTPNKSNIKAVVFNLENDGVVKTNLERSSVYEEEVIDHFYIYKVFIPQVRVGSIIDIRYDFPGFPFEWRFQERIPVLHSELILEASPDVKYTKTLRGFEHVEQLSPTRWLALNVPAFKMEPFLSSYTNYITRFDFQVTSVGVKGDRFYYEISSSWRRVNEVLLNYVFADVLLYSYYLNQVARDIQEKEQNPQKQIALAYDYIQKNVKWNGVSSLVPSEDPRAGLKKNHSGNSADVNLLLVSLLKKMGLNATPVVLSTRNNGLLLPSVPALNKLNYVIARAYHDGKELLLDATSDKLIPGILPTRCLNGSGLIVEEGHENWVSLEPSSIKRTKDYITIDVGEDGTASAVVARHFGGYGYLEWVEKHETESDRRNYAEELEKRHSVNITEYTIASQDPKNLSVDESIKLDFSDRILQVDKEMIFSPFAISNIYENPFPSVERKYPVDLICPSDYACTVIVNIPQGYQMKSSLAPGLLTTADKSVALKVLTGSKGNQFQVMINLKVSKSVFSESEYDELRLLYAHYIQLINESLHITKT